MKLTFEVILLLRFGNNQYFDGETLERLKYEKHFGYRLLQWALLIFCMYASTAFAVPGAITVDHNSGCSPFVVHFSPTDAPCSGCTYSWNFGTGSPVSGYTASSSFIAAGIHVVTLTVTSGSTITTGTVNITVYSPPVVSFTVSDTAFCPGKLVTFTHTGSNASPGYTSKSWSFGDGGVDTGNITTHYYGATGLYNTALTVTNAQGCSSTLSYNNHINVYALPSVSFTQDKYSVCHPPGNILFTNHTTGFAPLSYVWKFGEGPNSTFTSPSHTFSTLGTYQATVVATDGHGCKDSVAGPSYVTVGNVTAGFTFPDTICQYGQATFTNTSSSHTYRTWSFGDGSADATTLNASHTYTATGTFTVRLVALNSPCSDTVSHQIHVVAGPPGGWIKTPLHPCPAPVSVTYTSAAPAGTIVIWNFEEQYTEGGYSVSHNYAIDSVEHVQMIKIDPSTGCRDTVFALDTLYDRIHPIMFDSIRGCAPVVTTFTDTLLTSQPGFLTFPYPFPATSEEWDFGDGSPHGYGHPITHTFVDTGQYRVSVVTTTSNGCTIFDTLIVQAGVPPSAIFSADTTHVCRNIPVTFTATVTVGPVDSFDWDFSDFETHDKTGINVHEFSIPGLFTVTLTPAYRGCSGPQYIIEDYIRIDSPAAEFHMSYLCNPHMAIAFGDSSTGGDTRTWYFGDGDTSVYPNPVHTYTDEGTYAVTIISANSLSGCTDTVTDSSILVVNPDPWFTSTTTHVCNGDSVVFFSHDTSLADLAFIWKMNGYSSILSSDKNIKYPFPLTGFYDISLIYVDNNLCWDTVTVADYIVNGKPIADFYASPPKGCEPARITFHDTSYNIPGVHATRYFWDFGDGDTASRTYDTVRHNYMIAGTYTVTEVVLNDATCSDTVQHTITIYKAQASFSATPGSVCIGNAINFSNTSVATSSILWDLDDGTTTPALSFPYTYADTGHYDVRLFLTDTNGCHDTALVHVSVLKPVASFTADDTESVCNPFHVQFTNTSIGGGSYNWSFGDGNTSIVPSPAITYTAAGIYTVSMVATNPIGCKDTTFGTIKVYGYPGSFTYSPLTGCSPLTVHFSSTLSTVPHITWDFADGVTLPLSGVDTASHTYLTPGAYVPKLILSDSAGCVTSSIGLDTIKVSSVTAHMSTTPASACPGVNVTFVDASTTYWSPITTRAWTIDGTPYAGASPSHIFSTPGTYTVHLQTTNGWGCTGTTDTTIVVNDAGQISGDTLLCVGDTSQLTATITGGTWSISPSTTAISVSGTGKVVGLEAGITNVTYTRLGCYVVEQVTVLPLPAMITGTDTLCAGDTTTLSSTPVGGIWTTIPAAVLGTTGTPGKYAGIAAGTAFVTYEGPNGCRVYDTVIVNTAPAPIVGDTTICTGLATFYTNTVGGGVWSSSDPSTIGITPVGAATGIANGSAVISYTIGNCYATYSVTVNDVIPAITGIASVCPGQTSALSDIKTGGTWSSGDISVATVSSSGMLYGVSSGTSLITYSLGGGCFDTIVAEIYELPDTGIITGPAGLCPGDTIMFADTVVGGTWSGSQLFSTVLADGRATGVLSGTDTVFYTVANAHCTLRTSQPYEIYPHPVASVISGPATLCSGASSNYLASSTGGVWHASPSSVGTIDTITGAMTSIDTGMLSITYTDTPDVHGCVADTSISIHITLPDFLITADVTGISCFGYKNGTLNIATPLGTNYTYIWSNGLTGPFQSGLDTGTYWIKITDTTTQCSLTDTMLIGTQDSMSFVFETVPDTCQLAHGSVLITTSGGTAPYTYAWTSPSGSTASSNMFEKLLTGTYTVTVTDMHGCAKTDTVSVDEAPCIRLIIYNVITPNGDGANDKWDVQGLDMYPNNTVQIFDKWGDMVYEKNGYNDDWYGQDKHGKDLPDGTYFYLIKLNEQNKLGGDNTFTGYVLLKR